MNKRLICLLFTVLFVFGMVTIVSSENGTVVSVSTSFKNTTATDIAPCIIFALYQKQNGNSLIFMQHSVADQKTIAPNQTETYTANLVLPDSDYSKYEIKSFVWDSIANQKPYVNAGLHDLTKVAYTVPCEADATLRGGIYSNNVNGVNDSIIEMKLGGALDNNGRDTVMKFSLPDIGSDGITAKLVLTKKNSLPGQYTGGIAYLSDDSWLETNVTMGNRPGDGIEIGTWTDTVYATANTKHEIDITQQVKNELSGDRVLSLRAYVKSPSNYTGCPTFYSRTANIDDEYKPVILINKIITVSNPYALYDASELEGLREKLSQGIFLTEYNREKGIAESRSISDLDKLDSINSFKDYTFDFTAPAGTVRADLDLKLSQKGSIIIDQVSVVKTSNAQAISINNSSFETGTPDYWQKKIISGNPLFEVVANYVSQGSKAVKITNYSDSDIGAWSQNIAVEPQTSYTVKVSVRQDDVNNDGFSIGLNYKNSTGGLINSINSSLFNVLTLNKWDNVCEEMQNNAVVYMKENSVNNAEKAKKLLLYSVDNMIKGMNYRLKFHNSGKSFYIRDDSYGAVIIGRGMVAASITYDMIKNSNVFSQSELDMFLNKMYRISDIMMDTSYYDYTRAGFNQDSNWNSDRAAGVGVFAMVFPEYAKSAQYLQHAKQTIYYHLDHVITDEGALPETVRYHGAVLNNFIPFAKILKRYDGTNLFVYTKFKAMFDFIMKVQTPPDSVTKNNLINVPAIGDSGYTEETFRYLGYVASEYSETDPVFSKNLQFTWIRAGSPIKETGTGHPIMALLYADPALPSLQPVLTSQKFDTLGYSIFRQNPFAANEKYFLLKSASKELNHRHYDEGSFILYSDSTPLCLDSGVGSYSGSDLDWYRSSAAHNTLQFKDAQGNLKDGPVSSTIQEFYSTAKVDYVRTQIPDTMASVYKRHAAYIKDGFDVYIIWDNIRGNYNSRFNLHTLSSSTDIMGSSAVSHCYNNKDLQIEFMLPVSASIVKQPNGKISISNPYQTQAHFTVDGIPDQDFLVLLYPKDKTAEKLTVSPVTTDTAETYAYRIQKSDGTYFIVLINESTSVQNINLNSSVPLADMRNSTLYPVNGSNILVSNVSSGAAVFLKSYH